MWITARLIIALLACLYRLLFQRVSKSFPLNHNGVPYSLYSPTTQNGRQPSKLETPVTSKFICTLSRETTFDRWAKRLGFGDELEVRDAEFDNAIFILGDHPLTAEYLSSSAEIRDRIRALIPQSVLSIHITGKTLRFIVKPGVDPNSLLDDLVLIRTALEAIQHTAKSHFKDPHYTNAVILQALIMGVVTYGLVAFTEMQIQHESYHLDNGGLIIAGIGVSLGVAVALVALTWVILGHSSRAVRLMVENAALLMLSLPVVGYQALSDINRGMDKSDPVVVTSQVVTKRTKWHRKRRGEYATYHFELTPQTYTSPFPFTVPRQVTVTQDVYLQLTEGDAIKLEIAKGYLGYPWYVSIGPSSSP